MRRDVSGRSHPSPVATDYHQRAIASVSPTCELHDDLRAPRPLSTKESLAQSDPSASELSRSSMNVLGRGASVRMNFATGPGPISGRASSSGANSAFGGASTVTVETLSLYESVVTLAGTITGANGAGCASGWFEGYRASDSG